MKRIATLIAVSTLVLLGATSAMAVDVNINALYEFSGSYVDNNLFTKKSEDEFLFTQRVRPRISMIASENLSSLIILEIGHTTWGRNQRYNDNLGSRSGGSMDADGVNVKTKRVRVDWVNDNKDVIVNLGIQGVALPSATGFRNPVFCTDVAGALVTHHLSKDISITGFWLRPFDSMADGESKHLDDELDLVGFMLPVKGAGWKFAPWAMYGRVGAASSYYEYTYKDSNTTYNQDAEGKTNGWWGGGALNLDLYNPLTMSFDVMYGSIGKNEFKHPRTVSYFDEVESSGWFVDARADYLTSLGKVGVFGWWSSGDDYDDAKNGKFGRIPIVGMDGGYSATSFGMLGAPYGVSHAVHALVTATAVGTWGVGAQIAEVSFIEDITHLLRVAYYEGTNDKDLAGQGLSLYYRDLYLTSGDYAIEVNFDHKWKVDKNTTLQLLLGYIDLNMDASGWRSTYNNDPAWKAQMVAQFSF